jgi:NSS family neurotransmitter:Na+ symporter
MSESRPRERFTSSLGVLLTMIGVAVGLGNVWRFPYMVGRFGGAAFVLLYLVMVVAIGIPALMTEWALGRHTRRGTVGAFERAGMPLGRFIGWFFFFVVTAATAYYTNVVGWVLFHGIGQLVGATGGSFDAAAILPPEAGFSVPSLLLQLACSAVVIGAVILVLLRGLRSGIEKASKLIMPALLAILLILIIRSVTLPGSGAGITWYILKLDLAAVTPGVTVAAMGQAVFSLSLGGTFMVVYGSYLGEEENLLRNAGLTAFGDTAAGVLAGLAIFPAVFAFGMEPGSGPGLLFSTLPSVFSEVPVGWAFGGIFFLGLFGAAYLSDVAAFEVLVAGLTDNTNLTRARAVWLMAGAVFLLSLPPMLNNRIFVPWDLTFGSGMQTLGSLLAVLSVGWAIDRSEALKELSSGRARAVPKWLYYWIRFVIPGAVLTVGIWWLLTEVSGRL